MSDSVLAPKEALVYVERIQVPSALSWRDLQPGLAPEAIRADLVLQVCGKEVRFPQIHYGFGFASDSPTSLKGILQAVVALEEGRDSYWRASHGGVLMTRLQLSKDPAEHFEIFVFDDAHLYFTYHTNHGGALALDALLSVPTLVQSEERATELLIEQLDERDALADLNEWRRRYRGRWEHLKSRALSLSGHLLSFVPSTDLPIA